MMMMKCPRETPTGYSTRTWRHSFLCTSSSCWWSSTTPSTAGLFTRLLCITTTTETHNMVCTSQVRSLCSFKSASLLYATQSLERLDDVETVDVKPNTHRRRLPTKIWKLNMLRIYPVELSRVELCRRCVHARRLSWSSLQFCSLYVTGAENWKLGHDWRLVRSHRRHDATQLRCRQIVQTRRDSSRLSPTSREFNTHCRRNSTRQLSCVGVGGVYWALEAWFQRNTDRKWHMGYQMVTWAMTSREPRCCDAVRSAILATAWLLMLYYILWHVILAQ